MEPIEKRFGRAVRQRRNKLKISQEDFADLAGIHRTYMSAIELGKVQISIRIAEQIAQAFRLPLSKLWQDVERMSH